MIQHTAVCKSEIYSSLYEMCDNLRGGMDPSQYKNYILTLLFVKYISDKFKGNPYAGVIVLEGDAFDGRGDRRADVPAYPVHPLAQGGAVQDLDGEGRGGVRFVINDGINNNFPKANSIVGTSDWTHYAYEHTAGPKTNAETPSYVRIRIGGAACTAWIDDVRIEVIAAPRRAPVTAL